MADSPPDREPSPDWLRTFQTPLQDFKTLSSSSPSNSSHDATPKERSKLVKLHRSQKTDSHFNGDLKEEVDSALLSDRTPRVRVRSLVDLDTDDDEEEEEKKIFSMRGKPPKRDILQGRGKKADAKLQSKMTKKPKEEMESLDQTQQIDSPLRSGGIKSVKWTALEEEDDQADARTPIKASPKIEDAVLEEDATDGQERRTKRVASILPLVFGDKIHRSKILLECEGDALDLSGDVGAVGRFSVLADPEDAILLDLKGIIYKATIVPSNTFFVVNIGQSEAKVEAIMNDFVQLQPNTNIFETETMVEGTLEGFAFDSDDDGERAPASAGITVAQRGGDESEDGEKPSKKRAKSGKTLKDSKGPVKKAAKAGTSKGGGKSGISRKTKFAGKSTKKSGVSRKSKATKKTGK